MTIGGTPVATEEHLLTRVERGLHMPAEAVRYVNHQYSVHPVFQRVTRHDFFEKIQIYCFLILCGILPLLVTRDITTWKE